MSLNSNIFVFIVLSSVIFSAAYGAKEINVALDKNATQLEAYETWTADKAVDGCTRTDDPGSQHCCSASVGTAGSTDNFWKVELGQLYRVGLIVVYGRTDNLPEQLQNFHVYGQTQPGGDGNVDDMLYNNTVPYNDGIFEIDVNPERNLSIIRIERPTDNGIITLCEVQVYEACDDGFYGTNCSACGRCLDNMACDKVHGQCPSSCQTGWQGDTCQQLCSNGTFGDNCTQHCGSCLNNAVCNTTSGVCPDGCDPGYQGDNCDTECANGTYGFNCNTTCGYCFNATQCDVVSGNCSSCDAGYRGEMCIEECMSPMFGLDCLQACNCLNNDTCNNVNGSCPRGCAVGWDGTSCSEECQNLTFGQNCNQTCGKCLNNETCDSISGICATGCAPGWRNDTCDLSCEGGFFGANCTQVCGNCIDNATCHFETGNCTDGCAAGWHGNTCEMECNNGTFGADCVDRCYCADREPCDRVTGICPAGCDIGMSGHFCHTDLNMAINKTAMQSSTLFAAGFNWTADRAVDGNFEQSGLSRTCSSTELSSSSNVIPWWYLDMDSVSRINYITVYGQSGNSTELEEFSVYLSNSTNITDIKPAYNSSGKMRADGVYNISFGGSMVCQFLHITLENAGTLSLCEVRVFGECPDGSFGTQCEGMCYCADNVPCDKVTGLCRSGSCLPGWIGAQCNNTCDRGTYGIGCNHKCGSCADNMTCDAVGGVCGNGCSDGWLGIMCNLSCSSGNFGADCNNTCGHCKDVVECNHVTGNCNGGCNAGYHGSMCVTGCENGTYGEDCMGDCGNCVNDTMCHAMTGECDEGCMDGYVGKLCANAAAQTTDDSGSDTKVGAIVGGVIGGVVVIIIIAVAYNLYRKRSRSAGGDKTMVYYPSLVNKEANVAIGASNPGYNFVERSTDRYKFRDSTRL